MVFLFLTILSIAHCQFRISFALSPKGEKITKEIEKGVPCHVSESKSPLHSLPTKNVLASFDRWLFDERTNGEIGTIIATMNHLIGKIEKGIILESENERKIANGIGQMLRIAQQKTIGQMATDRKVEEHNILEKLLGEVDKVKKKDPFLAKTVEIWAERMPYLVDRIFDGKEENSRNLMDAIEKFCECLTNRKFSFTFSWKEFCDELDKLEKKEQTKLNEQIHGTEEKMWSIFPSPRGEGSETFMSPKDEFGGPKTPKLDIGMHFPGISNVPTLDLNASKLIRKREKYDGKGEKRQ